MLDLPRGLSWKFIEFFHKYIWTIFVSTYDRNKKFPELLVSIVSQKTYLRGMLFNVRLSAFQRHSFGFRVGSSLVVTCVCSKPHQSRRITIIYIRNLSAYTMIKLRALIITVLRHPADVTLRSICIFKMVQDLWTPYLCPRKRHVKNPKPLKQFHITQSNCV